MPKKQTFQANDSAFPLSDIATFGLPVFVYSLLVISDFSVFSFFKYSGSVDGFFFSAFIPTLVADSFGICTSIYSSLGHHL